MKDILIKSSRELSFSSLFRLYADYILIVIASIFCFFLASLNLYWVSLPGEYQKVDDNSQSLCISDDDDYMFSRPFFKIFPSERFAVSGDINQERFVIKYIYLSRDTSRGSSESLNELSSAFFYGYINDLSDNSVLASLKRKDSLRFCARIFVSDVKMISYENTDEGRLLTFVWKEAVFNNYSPKPIDMKYCGNFEIRSISGNDEYSNPLGFYIYSVDVREEAEPVQERL